MWCGASCRAGAPPSTAPPANVRRRHGVRDHQDRDRWRRRRHPPRPAPGAQRAQLADDARGRRGAARLRRGREDRLHRARRFAEGLRRRGRHQGDGGAHLCRRIGARPVRGMGRLREPAQAGHRGRLRLRAGRRMRARHDVRLHHRRPFGAVRPAGDQAGHHSRHGRLAAAGPLRRQVEGHGHDPDRPQHGRRGGRTLRPGLAGGWPTAT